MVKKNADIAGEMVDREAIRDCLYRYCRGIDRIDVELILSAYWPDASDEHGNFIANSAQEFVDHAVPILRAMEQTKSVLTNTLIDIQGDRAFVESYIQVLHRMSRPDGSRYDHLSSGRYLDRMERRNDEWRIQQRVIVRDWFLEFENVVGWEEGALGKTLEYGKERALNIGMRKPHDLSYEILRPAPKP